MSEALYSAAILRLKLAGEAALGLAMRIAARLDGMAELLLAH